MFFSIKHHHHHQPRLVCLCARHRKTSVATWRATDMLFERSMSVMPRMKITVCRRRAQPLGIQAWSCQHAQILDRPCPFGRLQAEGWLRSCEASAGQVHATWKRPAPRKCRLARQAFASTSMSRLIQPYTQKRGAGPTWSKACRRRTSSPTTSSTTSTSSSRGSVSRMDVKF